MQVTRKSIFSGTIRTIELPITKEQLESYEKGNKLLQNAFPNLTPGQREFIKTGITEYEWDKMFGKNK